MKCYIPGQNVKVLGRTVHALARFSDELYLESLTDCVVLRTLNAAESAYAMVKFNKNFFSYFNYNYFSTDDNEGLKCKISMKSALNTFKSPNHMDKQVESLEIKLDPEACKLIFQLKCKHGIVKTHYVSILDCKTIHASYTKDLVPNRITSHQKILSEALGHFQSNDDQITIEVKPDSLLLRNYIDSVTDYCKLIRTQINLKPSEFDSYIIGVDTVITFTMKEFRALLNFAEALNLPIQLHFETTGKPAVFIIHNGATFEAHFVLATSKADDGTQSTTQYNRNKDSSKRKVITPNNSVVNKKPHLDNEDNCNLFNFSEDPDLNVNSVVDINNSVNKNNSVNINNNVSVNNSVNVNNENDKMDCDDIPPSPTSRKMVNTVFRRCFEKTFDPRGLHSVVLAENSDSE